jgi:hypothetical protein
VVVNGVDVSLGNTGKIDRMSKRLYGASDEEVKENLGLENHEMV